MEDMRNAYNILVRKPGGKRPLGGPRHRWEDNIRMKLREIWWEGMDWMHLAFPCEHGDEPLGSVEGGEFLD
jgi:hypothetical protein